MNNHLRRIKEEDERFAQGRRLRSRKTSSAILLCVVIFAFLKYIIPADTQKKDDEIIVGSSNVATTEENIEANIELLEPSLGNTADSWNLIIVSSKNSLPIDFTVDLKTIDGKQVDAQIAPIVLKMIEDAREDEVFLYLNFTYCSVSEQEKIYERKLSSYKELGYNQEDSVQKVNLHTQPAGASEHHTGLAIDFSTSTPSATLNSTFADTLAYEWLSEHAEEYGFVERYQIGKEDITKTDWEPWHYRYIGADHAKTMNNLNLSLEEYVEQLEDIKK